MRRNWVFSTLLGAICFDFVPAANAGFNLGGGYNYAVLFEGGGNNHLSFNNGTISGNIGLGSPPVGTPQFALSGGAANTTIDGNVLFAGPVNVSGTAGTDYTITPVHTITGNNLVVQTTLNYLNSLSSTLGAESGASLAISVGNNATQTVNVASGILDGNGNRIFTVSSVSFVNGTTLLINGDGAGDSVVFNLASSANFNGRIVLGNGLSSDEVLFNLTGGSSLSGGPTLTISANGETLTGTFLDPNGPMQINHSILDGRFFGGDTHDDQIVSGASIIAPVPEPTMLSLLTFGLLSLLIARRSPKR